MRNSLLALPLVLALAGCWHREPVRVANTDQDPVEVVRAFLASYHQLEYDSLVVERESAEWTTEAYRIRCWNEWRRLPGTEFGDPAVDSRPSADEQVIAVPRTRPPGPAEKEESYARLLFRLRRAGVDRWRIAGIEVEHDAETRFRVYPPP